MNSSDDTGHSGGAGLPGLISRRIGEAARSADVDAAFLQLADLFPRMRDLAPLAARGGGHCPPTRVAVVAALVAHALNRVGEPGQVEPMLRAVADAYWPKRARAAPDRGLSEFTFLYPFLMVPRVEAALATGEPKGALHLLSNVQGPAWGRQADWFSGDEFIAEVLELPAVADRLERLPSDPWIFSRMLQVRAARALDFAVECDVDFETNLLRAALIAGESASASASALPIVEEHLAERARLLRLCDYHLGFHCVLILGDLGRQGEAFALARDIVRHGYGLAWRFNLEAALGKAWTQVVRQNECLAELASTAEYQQWLDAEVRYVAPSDADPIVLCHVSEGTWGGKKPCKCAITRVPIAPGDPVVRIRRYLDQSGSGKVETAAVTAFAEGEPRRAREELEGFAMPLDHLFPDPRRVRMNWRNSDIAAFAYDVAGHAEGARSGGLDVERAARLIAEAAPPRPRFLWTDPDAPQGWREPFAPLAQDCGYGDPVTLFWRVWRAGFGRQVVQHALALGSPRADKVMAMIGTFKDATLRRLAAEHFRADDLPEMMELAFKPRLKLEDHRVLADFGAQHPRYRAGIVAAMGAYGLHLYNTGGATANWYLDGLDHYTSAHGSQLLYLLLHSPQEDAVLAGMLADEVLPRDTSRGGRSHYGDTKSMYYRAACLHLAWHDRARLGVWQSGWIGQAMTRSYDRATHRILKAALK